MFGLDGPDAIAADSLGLIRGRGRLGRGLRRGPRGRRGRGAGVSRRTRSATSPSAAWAARRSPPTSSSVPTASACARPSRVVRDYYLPGWIGENTLVILSSYSGGTEETLTCASQATERNCLCVAVTSGGKLGSHYADEGVPVVPVVPGLQPRAAILRMLMPAGRALRPARGAAVDRPPISRRRARRSRRRSPRSARTSPRATTRPSSSPARSRTPCRSSGAPS